MKSNLHLRSLSVLLGLCALNSARAQIHITEFFYQGQTGAVGNEHEFVELTNVGSAPINLAGWRYDDDSASFASGFDLSGLGVVQPGQSVIFTDLSEADFRTVWTTLDAGVTVLGGSTIGLGRNDTITIFDAGENIVDQLAFGVSGRPGASLTGEGRGKADSYR